MARSSPACDMVKESRTPVHLACGQTKPLSIGFIITSYHLHISGYRLSASAATQQQQPITTKGPVGQCTLESSRCDENVDRTPQDVKHTVLMEQLNAVTVSRRCSRAYMQTHKMCHGMVPTRLSKPVSVCSTRCSGEALKPNNSSCGSMQCTDVKRSCR